MENLSRVKIPQRQEREIGQYIVRQNLVLPKDFITTDTPQHQSPPKADSVRGGQIKIDYADKQKPMPSVAGEDVDKISSQKTPLPTPPAPSLTLPSREGKGGEQGEEQKEQGEERKAEKGVMGVMGEKGAERSELAKGLKWGQDNQIPNFQYPPVSAASSGTPVAEQSSLRGAAGQAISKKPLPPIPPKPTADIDKKLEELRRKAEKSKNDK